MTATRDDLLRWFDQGVEQGATYMIVRCDGFGDPGDPDSDCCYPVFVKDPAEVRKRAHKGSDRLMEVYDLNPDRKDEQFATRQRVFNYPTADAGNIERGEN